MNKKPVEDTNYSIATRLIYGKSHTDAWDYDYHVIPPVTQSSSFRLESASRGAAGFGAIGKLYPDDPGYDAVFVYDRMGEPNNAMLQQALAIAELKEEAITFASGMAAVTAACLFALEPGDEIISHRTVYGCTYSLFTEWLPRFGIKVHFCDLTNPNSFLGHLTEKTKVLYLESPANPTLELLDLPAIIGELKKVNATRSENRQILSVIDNTFATPYCQRPAAWGVDIIVHSLTKGLCGFGTEMGGAVICDRQYRDRLMLFRKDFGAILDPKAAWHILVYGVSTLPLRMRQQIENAQAIAEFLEQHPQVERVFYPGLPSFPQYEVAKRVLVDYDGNFAPGMMLYFTLRGKDAEDAKHRGEVMMNYIAESSYCITLAVSLGQLRTLIEHPGSMTHAAYSAEEQVRSGMHPGGIRLAVGIENKNDLIRDLELSLHAVAQQ